MTLLYLFSQNLLSNEKFSLMVQLRNADKLLGHIVKMIKMNTTDEDHGSSISKVNNKT